MILWVFKFLLAMQGVAQAYAPEGLITSKIFGGDKGLGYLSISALYQNPRWVTDYESLSLVSATHVGGNLLSAGLNLTVGNRFADRNSYFLRWDMVFLETQSLAVKYIHSDLNYIASAKESWGVEYNGSATSKSGSGVYYIIGAYRRWMKQRWNQPTWSPLNYTTDDIETYWTLLFGIKEATASKNFYTLDVNIRDTWNYYRSDNIGFEYSYNILTGKSSILQILLGIRTTGLAVGTGSTNEYSVGFGFTGM